MCCTLSAPSSPLDVLVVGGAGVVVVSVVIVAVAGRSVTVTVRDAVS
jgi:hypothetical protein